MPKRRYESGIKCPKCGKFTCDVAWTEPGDGHILRKRRCHIEGCDGELSTVERPIGDNLQNLAKSIGKEIQGDFLQIVESITNRR